MKIIIYRFVIWIVFVLSLVNFSLNFETSKSKISNMNVSSTMSERTALILKINTQVDDLIKRLTDSNPVLNINNNVSANSKQIVQHLNAVDSNVDDEVLKAFRSLNDNLLKAKQKKSVPPVVNQTKPLLVKLNPVQKLKHQINFIKNNKKIPKISTNHNVIQTQFKNLNELHKKYKNFDNKIKEKLLAELTLFRKLTTESKFTDKSLNKVILIIARILNYKQKFIRHNKNSKSVKDLLDDKKSFMDYQNHLVNFGKTESARTKIFLRTIKRMKIIFRRPERYYKRVTKIRRLQKSLHKLGNLKNRVIKAKNNIFINLKKITIKNLKDLQKIIHDRNLKSNKTAKKIETAKNIFNMQSRIKNTREKVKKMRNKVQNNLNKIKEVIKSRTLSEETRNELNQEQNQERDQEEANEENHDHVRRSFDEKKLNNLATVVNNKRVNNVPLRKAFEQKLKTHAATLKNKSGNNVPLRTAFEDKSKTIGSALNNKKSNLTPIRKAFEQKVKSQATALINKVVNKVNSVSFKTAFEDKLKNIAADLKIKKANLTPIRKAFEKKVTSRVTALINKIVNKVNSVSFKTAFEDKLKTIAAALNTKKGNAVPLRITSQDKLKAINAALNIKISKNAILRKAFEDKIKTKKNALNIKKSNNTILRKAFEDKLKTKTTAFNNKKANNAIFRKAFEDKLKTKAATYNFKKANNAILRSDFENKLKTKAATLNFKNANNAILRSDFENKLKNHAIRATFDNKLKTHAATLKNKNIPSKNQVKSKLSKRKEPSKISEQPNYKAKAPTKFLPVKSLPIPANKQIKVTVNPNQRKDFQVVGKNNNKTQQINSNLNIQNLYQTTHKALAQIVINNKQIEQNNNNLKLILQEIQNIHKNKLNKTHRSFKITKNKNVKKEIQELVNSYYQIKNNNQGNSSTNGLLKRIVGMNTSMINNQKIDKLKVVVKFQK